MFKPAWLLLALLTSSAVFAGSMDMMNTNNIRHISGGVGAGERDDLLALTQGFSLKLTFAESNGDYRFDIPVTVLTTTRQPVLSTISYGPLLYADMPPGTYIIIADDVQTGQSKTIVITQSKQASLIFRSKIRVAP